MNEFLRKRIDRKLDTLPDERLYQVLDYIEFLESKYAERSSGEPSPFQKLAETVEDTLRAGKVSASAIRGTMEAMSSASRVVSGIAAAGRSVVDQVSRSTDKARIEQTAAASETVPEPPPDRPNDAPPPGEPPPGSA